MTDLGTTESSSRSTHTEAISKVASRPHSVTRSSREQIFARHGSRALQHSPDSSARTLRPHRGTPYVNPSSHPHFGNASASGIAAIRRSTFFIALGKFSMSGDINLPAPGGCRKSANRNDRRAHSHAANHGDQSLYLSRCRIQSRGRPFSSRPLGTRSR
jgi:hypothetical protein